MEKSTQTLLNEKFYKMLRGLEKQVEELQRSNEKLHRICSDLNTRIYELSLNQQKPERWGDIPVRPIGPYFDTPKSPKYEPYYPPYDPYKVWCSTSEQPALFDDETMNSLLVGEDNKAPKTKEE